MRGRGDAWPQALYAGLATLGLAAFHAVASGVHAAPRSSPQTEVRTVWDGVYTNEQSTKGQSLSKSACVACHGEQLVGAEAPSLQGEDFRANWSGRSVGELFEKIRTTMPSDSVGTLNAQQTAALIAYIFKLNDFPAGETDLTSDPAPLNEIKIRSKQ